MLARTDASKPRYSPGSGWTYSNIGYLYVRRLIERAADEELGDALQRLVFDPLGISHVRLASAREDLAGVEMGEAASYEPRWVYHGLMVGPLGEAALLLDRLMSGALLPGDLIATMHETRNVGGPVAGRPWITPGYGLGIMAGGVEGGTSVAGRTGGGPGSVIAVYRDTALLTPLCCTSFSTGRDAGDVEREAVRRVDRRL
jgi:CubicO group peptidase (beta-lactamase class C family)